MRLLRLLVPFICLLSLNSVAQKVGVVLSGGGANGLAHIGVLKALEENQIPIDYITGTSIGAFVGALYATGYSPDQIEALFSSQDFQNQAKGIVDDRYIYYFKQKEPNASWITVKFNPESILESLPPTNLISPEPIDLGLLELLAAPSAAAGYDFDSLFIPFRCVAADITLKKDKVFSEGSLNKAVRASIAYPFYLKPVIIDSSFYVDGGLYNNFPADVMYDEFLPDIIIGSNVAGPVSHPEEDNLLSQIRGMLVTITDYNTQCENGIMIEPITDVGLFEFEEPAGTIQVGYEAALKSIPEILERVHRRSTVADLTNARAQYRSTLPALNFHAISIDGLNRKQSIYVQKLVTERRKSLISMADFKKNYFRLISDNKLKNIYPDAVYDPILKSFELKLDIKKERRITAEFGGVVSNKPINQGYLGVEYHYLGRTAVSLMANTYFGKLYSSADVKGRLDFPSRLPYYLEGGATLNRWDFYKSNSLLLIDENPAYLVQNDKYAYAAVGLPVSNKGLLNVGYRYAQVRNHYYQTLLFSATDTTDRTDLNFVSGHVRYTRSSLNRKQYASDGTFVNVIARYVHGEEYSRPGSTARDQRPFRGIHEWSQIKGTFDSYFMQTGTFKFGVYLEGAYSTQPLFRNYTSSLLASPAFMPTPESTTLFLTQFRAFKYGAAGGKAIVSMLNSKLDLRLEGYVFQPYQAIRKGTDHSALLGPALNERYYLGSSTLVYHSPLGPIAVSGNYYPSSPKPFSFLFHIGYILFNRRAMD